MYNLKPIVTPINSKAKRIRLLVMKSLVETQMDRKEKTNLVQFIYFEKAQKHDKM